VEAILQHRLRAWSRLSFHGAIQQAQPQVFVTSHEAVLDTLQEVFERNHHQNARQIASLELPARRDPETELSSLAPLIDECPGLQAAMNACTSPQVEALEKLFTGCTADWSHVLDTRYPSGQFGRRILDLFLFPEISPRSLFMESFVGGSSAEADKNLTAGACVLVGFLRMDDNSA
jgi:hypothetical protein